MVLSKFENLPSELIVEISDYLDGCELYETFYGLNQRINTILDEHCHRLHVNFLRISKIKFDFYCNRILLGISSRIVSLTLCGDISSTPGQLALFLSRFAFISSIFIKLESLKLIDFLKTDIQLLLPQLSSLVYLKSLSIGDFKRLMPFTVNAEDLFNESVILPISLRYLAFPYEISNEWIETSSITKSFVEQIHVPFIHMDSLFLFLQRFPNLKRLTTILDNRNPNPLPIDNLSQSSVIFHTLRYLNMNITSTVTFDHFAIFLKSVPHLHSLSIEALNPDLDFFEARRWESVLPSTLSSFRFDFTMILPVNPDHLELLEHFKSHFWLSRGWFVQCHLRDHGRFFRLSTIRSPIISILYWPDDEVLVDTATTAVYPNVILVELWWSLSKSTHAICPNIRSLQLYGAINARDEPVHPNIDDILQHPSLEHLIINNDLPITQIRFASALVKSSDNVHILTCSTRWLRPMLEEKRYEWICLLVSIRIRKLILIDDQSGLSHTDLIAFVRTFINLHQITMKMESVEDLFFLLNTLGQLTMANIELPSNTLANVMDITKWIEKNTILLDFLVRKQVTTSNTCKLIFWIGSRRISNMITMTNYLRDTPWVNRQLIASHENF